MNNKYITVEYIPAMDISIIFEEITTANGKPVQTTIISFYYGTPNEKNTHFYYNRDVNSKDKPRAIYNM